MSASPKKEKTHDYSKRFKRHIPKVDYVSDTDPSEYENHPKLEGMTKRQRKAHILKLWNSAFACSFGISVLLRKYE